MRSRFVLAAVFTSSFVCAQVDRKPIFVSPVQLQAALVLPNPPVSGSSQAKADLAEVHRLQDTRTPDQIKRAQNDDVEEDIFIFHDLMGEKFTRSMLPLTAALGDHTHNDEGLIVNPAKRYFQRLRPFNFDASVKAVCKTNGDPKDYGYPSGHSVTGYLEALVLMMIVPEERDSILARADDYAHNRVICGVHYPSDTVASKSVAYAMIGLMMNQPQFKRELAAAKIETRTALGLPLDTEEH